MASQSRICCTPSEACIAGLLAQQLFRYGDLLIEHADDELVLAGWKPGEGRTLPPMSHAAFKKAWITWLNTGAFAPKK